MADDHSPKRRTALGAFVSALVSELGVEGPWSNSTSEGFRYWPHWAGQWFRYESWLDVEGGRHLFLRSETDWLTDIVSEPLAVSTAALLNINTNVGTALAEGTRVRFRSRVRVSDGPVGPSLLADAALLQACYVWLHGAWLDDVARKYGEPSRGGVPHRTAHPMSGPRATLGPVFAKRLALIEEHRSSDPPLRIDLERMAAQWRNRGLGSVEGGVLDGWLGARHGTDGASGGLDFDEVAFGRPGLDVAVARIDVSVLTRWFGPVLVARTIVPVPVWVTDDIGFAGADRFNAAEFADLGAPLGVGSWSFDRPGRRWVYTSLHPRAWLKPYYPDVLFGAMNARALWWLSTQRAHVVGAS